MCGGGYTHIMRIEGELTMSADDQRAATRQHAERWRREAIRELQNAGDRLDWNVAPIIDSFTAVYWDEEREAWTFDVTHDAAVFMEHGTDPHLIEADQAEELAFTVGGETVFTKTVEHPGTPAVRFVSKARERVAGGE
jgi:hypothetical protein